MKLIASHRIDRKEGKVLPGADFIEVDLKEAEWLIANGAAKAAPDQSVAEAMTGPRMESILAAADPLHTVAVAPRKVARK